MKPERALVLALCLAAACRVFLFSAAFPYFNNADESAHFDLVVKYSHGEIPRTEIERYSREAVQFIVLYGSPEYFSPPGSPAGVPGWRDPIMRQPDVFERTVATFQAGLVNHEAGGFPAYYAVAGGWLGLGRAMGLAGGNLLYWTRFLDVLVLAGLVWLSYWAAHTLFPECRVTHLGVPILLAFFPQDVFYSVNSDVLTPLLFAVAFVGLMRIVLEDRSMAFHVLTGLAVSAAFLTKASNVTLMALLGLVIVVKLRELNGCGKVRSRLPRLASLLVAGVLPATAWLVRNRIVLGDFSGSVQKVAQLQWTLKPPTQWWQHPIFSPGGLAYFLAELTRTFWRGEFVWHLERIASPLADAFYVVSTAVFLAASALALWRGAAAPHRRLVLSMSFILLGLSVALLAGLSIAFDFDGCWYPSRERPYFVSGRLIAGTLLPFLLVYVDGLGHVVSWTTRRVAPVLVVSLIASAMTFSEIVLTLPVFHSIYNWFHLG